MMGIGDLEACEEMDPLKKNWKTLFTSPSRHLKSKMDKKDGVQKQMPAAELLAIDNA